LWLFAVAALAFEWRFRFGFEAVAASLVADLLYGPIIPGLHYLTLLSTILLIFVPLIEYLKVEMRLGRRRI
jgi:hypothetical protein